MLFLVTSAKLKGFKVNNKREREEKRRRKGGKVGK